MSEFTILKWVLGGDILPPDTDDVDGVRLLALLAYHGLVHRLLGKFGTRPAEWYRRAGHGPAWYTRSLVEQLLVQHTMIEGRLANQIRAIRSIASELDTRQFPIAVIKGFSVYAVSNCRRDIHPSGDVDVFCRDPEELVKALTRLGFSIQHFPVGGPRPIHELATAWREDVYVEIHNFFPCWTFPPQAVSANLMPANFPGHWMQRFSDGRLSPIPYTDILENHRTVELFSDAQVVMPSIELALVICCAHVLSDYIKSAKSRIRLCELTDAQTLLRAASFNTTRFLELVVKFWAMDACSLTFSLLRQYCGTSPLDHFDDRSQQELASLVDIPDAELPFPAILSTFGGWVVPCRPDDLLAPLRQRDYISWLGANEVGISSPDTLKNYTVNWRADSDELARVIDYGSDDESIRLQLSISKNSAGLYFDLYFPTELEGENSYHIVIDDITGSPPPSTRIDTGSKSWERNCATGVQAYRVGVSSALNNEECRHSAVEPLRRLLAVAMLDAHGIVKRGVAVPLLIHSFPEGNPAT